jgi:hypothetical protein
MSLPSRCIAAAIALLIVTQATVAQAATLSARDTLQRGNFAVGAGTNTDNGNYLLDVVTLEPVFSNAAADSGSAAGASASYSTAQAYALQADGLDFSGSAVTAVNGPVNVVSFADSLSQLELVFVLDQATPFELRVDLVETLGATVNNFAPRADAQFRLSGPGDVWLYNAAGSFVQTGVLAPGTWRIDAFADARGNGHAGFAGRLALAPVPEPAPWLLMALGLAALVLARRRSLTTTTTPSWSVQR